MILYVFHNLLVVVLAHSKFLEQQLKDLRLYCLPLTISFLHQLWRFVRTFCNTLLESIVV